MERGILETREVCHCTSLKASSFHVQQVKLHVKERDYPPIQCFT